MRRVLSRVAFGGQALRIKAQNWVVIPINHTCNTNDGFVSAEDELCSIKEVMGAVRVGGEHTKKLLGFIFEPKSGV